MRAHSHQISKRDYILQPVSGLDLTGAEDLYLPRLRLPGYALGGLWAHLGGYQATLSPQRQVY